MHFEFDLFLSNLEKSSYYWDFDNALVFIENNVSGSFQTMSISVQSIFNLKWKMLPCIPGPVPQNPISVNPG